MILTFRYFDSIQKTITQYLPWDKSGSKNDYSSYDWKLMVIAVTTVIFIHSEYNNCVVYGSTGMGAGQTKHHMAPCSLLA